MYSHLYRGVWVSSLPVSLSLGVGRLEALQVQVQPLSRSVCLPSNHTSVAFFCETLHSTAGGLWRSSG